MTFNPDTPCFLQREGCLNLATHMVEGKHLALQSCEAHVERMRILVGPPGTVTDLAVWREMTGL